MFARAIARSTASLVFVTTVTATALLAQAQPRIAPANAPQIPKPPTHADIFRGEYGRDRAHNEVLALLSPDPPAADRIQRKITESIVEGETR